MVWMQKLGWNISTMVMLAKRMRYAFYTLSHLLRVSLANERDYHCRIVAAVDSALHAHLKRSNLTGQIGLTSAT